MAAPVVITDYNPHWPIMYEEEKSRILGVIEHKVVNIEHIGSTAVPGLGAKPIIDIMAGFHRLSDAEECIEPLQTIGYEYSPPSIAGIPERRYLNKANYHLHMVEVTSDFWKRHLLFRDSLRTHPEVAQQYLELKKDLAARHGTERESYTEAKTSFIEQVVERARAENKTNS
jgi:GrpB-like predicted nucleotidyltransferase (UPF0157 family)